MLAELFLTVSLTEAIPEQFVCSPVDYLYMHL